MRTRGIYPTAVLDLGKSSVRAASCRFPLVFRRARIQSALVLEPGRMLHHQQPTNNTQHGHEHARVSFSMSDVLLTSTYSLILMKNHRVAAQHFDSHVYFYSICIRRVCT